jgi:small subunit ribosomal protein S9
MVQVHKDKTTGVAIGTGRRKSSVARARVKPGSGKITINNRPIEEFFPCEQDRKAIHETLDAVGHRDSLDVEIRVNGGGLTGQSGACRMGIARALVSYSDDFFGPLRDGGFLTRDSRMKERKKPGLHGARRGTQFSKR